MIHRALIYFDSNIFCRPYPSLHYTLLGYDSFFRCNIYVKIGCRLPRMFTWFISLCWLRVFFFFYSCWSLLELRASVKRFASFQFLNLRQTVGLLGRRIILSQRRYLTQTQNKHKQTFMPWVGFEFTISVFERTKTFHALDCAATVTCTCYNHDIFHHIFFFFFFYYFISNQNQKFYKLIWSE
jgi:hypothetical protein